MNKSILYAKSLNNRLFTKAIHKVKKYGSCTCTLYFFITSLASFIFLKNASHKEPKKKQSQQKQRNDIQCSITPRLTDNRVISACHSLRPQNKALL